MKHNSKQIGCNTKKLYIQFLGNTIKQRWHNNRCIHSRYFYLPSPVDSILLAVFTVSPNKQYLGIFKPTTPAQTGPTLNDNK